MSARCQVGSLIKRELARPSDPAIFHLAGAPGGIGGDRGSELGMFGDEVQEGDDRFGQLASVVVLAPCPVVRSLCLACRADLERRFGLGAGGFDRSSRRQQTEQATVRHAAAPRPPHEPVVAGGLDAPGDEGIASRQELPPLRPLDDSVLGVPQAVATVVNVEDRASDGLVVHAPSLPSSTATSSTSATGVIWAPSPHRATSG